MDNSGRCGSEFIHLKTQNPFNPGPWKRELRILGRDMNPKTCTNDAIVGSGAYLEARVRDCGRQQVGQLNSIPQNISVLEHLRIGIILNA